jgi:hypothetical protein
MPSHDFCFWHLADISTAAVHHLKSAIADASAIHRALLI